MAAHVLVVATVTATSDDLMAALTERARRGSSAAWSGPEAGITSLKSTGTELRRARSLRAARRSSEAAVTVATTSTCAAMRPSSVVLVRSLRLRERQVDDLRAHAVVADRERVARRRLATDER